MLGGGAGSAPGRQCQGSGRFWGSGRAMVTHMEGRRGVECQTRVRRGSVHGGGLTQGVGAVQGKEGALWGAPWCSLCPDESAPMPVPYDPRTHVRLGKRHSQHTLHLRPRRSDRHLLLLYESLRGGGRVGGCCAVVATAWAACRAAGPGVGRLTRRVPWTRDRGLRISAAPPVEWR